MVDYRKADFLLVERILSGEERALLEFYQHFAPRLFSYIRVRVENLSDDEEILQDTLLATLEALRDFTGRSSLSTFVYAICHHKIVDYYRKRKIRQVLFSKMPGLEELVSTLLGPEERLDEQLLKERIELTLRRLRPNYRVVLIFKYLDGLSVLEIAHRLSETVKTVESRIFRARRAFVKIWTIL